ncbi:hypothetical protein NPIL_262721 [Nephila pilipes]|uniref:RING-type domain-containing protein n=1 Tax=Nephila pilipes TaxID=299642 RepID=A0A8X6TVT9_NEPPI|nr:hypothetical protein NPIL_262721 [Nephila pilipes]
MKSYLYRKAARAWLRCGPQDLSQRKTLGRTAMDYLYSAPWSDAVSEEPEKCPICLLVMHRPVKTHCGHVFHEKCLKRARITNPTCPFCRQSSIV